MLSTGRARPAWELKRASHLARLEGAAAVAAVTAVHEGPLAAEAEPLLQQLLPRLGGAERPRVLVRLGQQVPFGRGDWLLAAPRLWLWCGLFAALPCVLLGLGLRSLQAPPPWQQRAERVTALAPDAGTPADRAPPRDAGAKDAADAGRLVVAATPTPRARPPRPPFPASEDRATVVSDGVARPPGRPAPPAPAPLRRGLPGARRSPGPPGPPGRGGSPIRR